MKSGNVTFVVIASIIVIGGGILVAMPLMFLGEKAPPSQNPPSNISQPTQIERPKEIRLTGSNNCYDWENAPRSAKVQLCERLSMQLGNMTPSEVYTVIELWCENGNKSHKLATIVKLSAAMKLEGEHY